jgi:DNA-binding NtrC family response regulator
MINRKVFLYSQGSDTQVNSEQLRLLGWDVVTASDIYSARSLIDRHGFHIGIVCLNQDYGGINRLEEFLLTNKSIEWIAVVAAADRRSPSFGKLIGEYFYDYHTLPLDFGRLAVTLGHAYGKAELKHRPIGKTEGKGEFQMIGASRAMQDLYRNLQKIHDSDAPVLIRGESGTGKELAARAIHKYSRRGESPFIAVNCGSIPVHLVQSELFGHEKGAFTGAYRRNIGRIESAAGGTIFLDEIGDLSLELQVNLLRFLEEKTIRRVGATEDIRVDARVIAATHVDLEEAVKLGRFREDLYYRINVLQLEIPPLRSRDDDFELLAREYFEEFSRDGAFAAKGFSKQALLAMKNHDWPGNVRELINRVRRAVVMSEGRLITPRDLGLERRDAASRQIKLNMARSQTEQLLIRRALRLSNNNVSAAARQLGVSRVTLYRLMNKLQIGP